MHDSSRGLGEALTTIWGYVSCSFYQKTITHTASNFACIRNRALVRWYCLHAHLLGSWKFSHAAACRVRPHHSEVRFEVVKEIQFNELWPSHSTFCLLCGSHLTEEHISHSEEKMSILVASSWCSFAGDCIFVFGTLDLPEDLTASPNWMPTVLYTVYMAQEKTHYWRRVLHGLWILLCCYAMHIQHTAWLHMTHLTPLEAMW